MRALHDELGKRNFKVGGVDIEETGLALQIRLPGVLHVLNKSFEHYFAKEFRQVEFTADTAYNAAKGWPRPGVWKSTGSATNYGIAASGHPGYLDSAFGSFFVKTTNPNRMTVLNGKGRLVFLYR